MVVKCKACGMNFIVERGIYGAPIMQCAKCGCRFLADKIREPALEPPHRIVRERPGGEDYATLVAGIGFMVAGIVYACKQGGSEWLIMAALGLFLLGTSAFALWIPYHTYRVRCKAYEALLAESQERLRNLCYQQELITVSEYDGELIEKINRFNRLHHISREYSFSTRYGQGAFSERTDA